MGKICEHCVNELRLDGSCAACELYNAAVAAQQAAAAHLAKTRKPRASSAWLNRFGIFAWVEGVAVQLGTAEEAAVFMRLTSDALSLPSGGRS
jgi:hypothetical protein